MSQSTALEALINRVIPEEQRQAFREEHELTSSEDNYATDYDANDNADAAIDYVEQVNDIAELDEIQRAESARARGARSTVNRAIEAQREALQEREENA